MTGMISHPDAPVRGGDANPVRMTESNAMATQLTSIPYDTGSLDVNEIFRSRKFAQQVIDF